MNFGQAFASRISFTIILDLKSFRSKVLVKYVSCGRGSQNIQGGSAYMDPQFMRIMFLKHLSKAKM